MIKKIWSAVSTVLVSFVVILALLLVGARVLGLQVYTVLSGSMEPNYHVGSIIYVKKVEPESLKVDDTITFLLSERTVATHRIVEVLPDEDDPNVFYFRTKGDNNDTVDANLVHSGNVLGRVVGTIPLLGYLFNFVQHPPGTYITLAAAALFVLAVFVPDIIAGLKDEDPPADERQQDNEKLKAQLEALKLQLQQQQNKESEENTNEES